MSNDEYIAYATKQYLNVKKTRADIIKLYKDLKQILTNYLEFDVMEVDEYIDLCQINAQLYYYFYSLVLYEGDK